MRELTRPGDSMPLPPTAAGVPGSDRPADKRERVWQRGWRWVDRRPLAWLLGLNALCMLLYLALIPVPRVDGQLVGSDGVHYYAYLPALFLEHSLDFSPYYRRVLPPEQVARIARTPTGHLHNAYA